MPAQPVSTADARMHRIASHVREVTDSHPHYAHYTEPGVYCYPAEEFEQKTGLTNIAKQYAMPEGKDPVEVFLPLFHAEVQTRVVREYADILEQIGSGSPEAVAAYDEKMQQKWVDFRQELDALRAEGSLDAMEQLAQQGYSLREDVLQSRGLRQLVEELGGISTQELREAGQLARAHWEQKTIETYNTLEALNPELSVLTPQIEQHMQRRDVVHGVLSKFNIPDIKCFSIDRISGIEARKDPAWVKRQDTVEALVGQTYWIPSPSTQRNIIAQAQERGRGQGADVAMAR